MIEIRQFVQSGGELNDDELDAMLRERMSKVPAAAQRDWLQQLDLSLDGYGGERQLAAVRRIREAVKRLGTIPPA
jgi:hypothetical protein